MPETPCATQRFVRRVFGRHARPRHREGRPHRSPVDAACCRTETFPPSKSPPHVKRQPAVRQQARPGRLARSLRARLISLTGDTQPASRRICVNAGWAAHVDAIHSDKTFRIRGEYENQSESRMGGEFGVEQHAALIHFGMAENLPFRQPFPESACAFPQPWPHTLRHTQPCRALARSGLRDCPRAAAASPRAIAVRMVMTPAPAAPVAGAASLRARR